MLARRRMPIRGLSELPDVMSLFGWPFGGAITEAADFLTNTEAYFKDGHLVIRAELAGVDPKSVDVSVAGRTLTIKGERKAPEVPMDDLLSGAYGRLERTVTVPEGLNADGIKAVWHNGIPEITITVSQALQPKKVPVENRISLVRGGWGQITPHPPGPGPRVVRLKCPKAGEPQCLLTLAF